MQILKNKKNKIFKLVIFILLLLLANIYLLRDGFWFYQDTSFWPKNFNEALILLLQPFHSFTNLGYYLGYDQGIFSFTRILPSTYTYLLYYLFGFDNSQVVLSMSGYVFTFISFYFFTELFLEKKNVRFALSLLYTFSPLAVSLQTTVYYNAIVPLFLFSVYKFFYSDRNEKYLYLIINILSVYLWISYIRFIQIGILLILPYIIYFVLSKRRIEVRRLIIYILIYLLVLLPSIYSLYSQFINRSITAFNYATEFQSFVSKIPHYEVFNLLQSFNVYIYENTIFKSMGILLFIIFLILLITYSKKRYTYFLALNLSLAFLGITLNSLGNILSPDIYHIVIKFFPFIVNGSSFALFVSFLPIVVSIGILTEYRSKFLYLYSILFIVFTIMPLLNLSKFDLKNYSLKNIPNPYLEYFVNDYKGFPVSTLYYPNSCWRAKYMEQANTPTICINYGMNHYVSAILDNPRLSSGGSYFFDKVLMESLPVDNLRITHNLKSIFVANDIVKKKGYGLDIDDKGINDIVNFKNLLDQDLAVNKEVNNNFTHYYFADRDKYDYYIYSPAKLYEMDIESFVDKQVKLTEGGVFVDRNTVDIDSESVDISYKFDIQNPTKYYIEISNIKSKSSYLIQFNQTFNKSWKLQWIDKQTYDSIDCISRWESFSITSNRRCQYNGSIFDIRDELFNVIDKPTTVHTEGNFINNLWEIKNDKTLNLDTNNSMYAIVYYDRQPRLILSIIIAFTTFFGIIIIAIFQLLKNIIINL